MVGFGKVLTSTQIQDVASFIAKYSGGYKTCTECQGITPERLPRRHVDGGEHHDEQRLELRPRNCPKSPAIAGLSFFDGVALPRRRTRLHGTMEQCADS